MAELSDPATASGLQIRDTAECNSALRRLRLCRLAMAALPRRWLTGRSALPIALNLLAVTLHYRQHLAHGGFHSDEDRAAYDAVADV